MPEHVTVLRVFVASPRDVEEERDILEQVIRELNITWGRSRGIMLDLVRWETQAYPGISSDPQAVINEQMLDDYDIFVGILWTRLGTRTGRAESGTLEEFQRAYERFRADPNAIRIMFYFRKTPLPPDEIDPEQLMRVNAFREQLGEEALYWTYSTLGDFEAFTRQHLSLQMQSWNESWGFEKVPETREVDVKGVLAEDKQALGLLDELEEEEGFLDLVERGVFEFERATRVTIRISDASVELSGRLEQRASEMQEVKQTDDSRVAAFKKVTNQTAADMMEYVTRMKEETPRLSDSLSGALNAYGKSAALLPEFEPEDTASLEDALKTVVDFESTLSDSLVPIGEFRDAVARMPRATTKLNRAKRETIAVVDTLVSELERAVNIAKETRNTMQNVLDQLKGRPGDNA